MAATASSTPVSRCRARTPRTTSVISKDRTSPTECFTSTEVGNIDDFIANGGAVILLGSSKATDAALTTTNDLADALGSDLRLNADEITDSSNNVNDDSTIPYTTVFDTSFPLFGKYS
jgi:hypothetical protein